MLSSEHYQNDAQALFNPDRIPGLTELWNDTLGDPGICIAVLDGDVELSHPALSGADLTRHDVLGRAERTGALGREHGTHVASIIFGQHDGPVKGVAPHCRGLVIPIYHDDGARVSCSQKDLATAIEEAIRLGAHVINISGGELSDGGAASDDLRRAIRKCVQHDRVIVAAAGNDGCRECLHVPGALPSVLAVGAMDVDGTPLPNSNWGDIYQLQGILAPGQEIPGAIPEGAVVSRSGSSFAAPIVSGVAGLLLSVQKIRGGTTDPFMVREALVRTARGCAGQVSTACARLLAGRLNVPGAIHFLMQVQGGQRMQPHTTAQGCPEGADPAHAAVTGEGTATDHAASAPDSARGQPSAGTAGPPAQASRGDLGKARRVSPSCGCGCTGGARQKVYAIGELDIDFVSPARRDSIQANAPGLPTGFGFDNAVENRAAFLRYLLGIEFKTEADVQEEIRAAVEQARSTALLNGNFYDAESVYWVLKQGECPMYAIRPQGPFAGAAYRQLVIFLIEQTFRNYATFAKQAISEHCLDEFYNCFGGTQQSFRDSLSRTETVSLIEESTGQESAESRPAGRRRRGKAGDEGTPEPEGDEGQAPRSDFGNWEAAEVVNSAFEMFNEPSVSAAHVAIAGEITGTVRLFTGEEVEVVAPVMRGMQNWNTRRLIEALLRSRSLNIAGFEAQVTLLGIKTVSRLYELVRNPGKDPCDRAKNYLATKELFNLAQTLANPAFLSLLGAFGPIGDDQRQLGINAREFLHITLDDLECTPAQCVRYGAEPYEVQLSFYNFANQFMGNAVVSQTIDVSDVVPIPMDKSRVFPRRS